MRGISSTGRPSQNFSKPRSSGTWKKQSATSPSASRKMSIFPCPSRRVIGSMLIRRKGGVVAECAVVIVRSSRASPAGLERARRQAEAVERPGRIGDPVHDLAGPVLGRRVDNRAERAEHGGALVGREA